MAHVKRRDAQGQRLVRHVDQSGLLHAVRQGFALRELGHALRQVLIGVEAVAGEHLPDPRQDAVEVPAIQGAERLPAWQGELQDGHAAAGAADARHLAQAAVRVAEIAQAEGHADDLELPVGKRKCQRVGFDEMDAGCGPGGAALPHAVG